MTEYYLDIETYSPDIRPDPANDKIITIQYQQVSTETGEPIGDLKILTEWELGSEKELLSKFKDVFLSGSDFNFISIGVNLYGFDFVALASKFNKYFDLGLGLQFFRDKIAIELKPILIMMNNGRLKGYTDILGKKHSGNVIKEWYEQKKHDEIIDYIKDEAKTFIEKYQILKKELPKIRFSE